MLFCALGPFLSFSFGCGFGYGIGQRVRTMRIADDLLAGEEDGLIFSFRQAEMAGGGEECREG